MSEDLAIPSKPINPRYYSLDIWRGLACLMIVLLHASFLFKTETAAEHRHDPAFAPKILAIFTRMQIGVPLFFVISGYCISATADASRRKSRAGPDYFKRRIRRIFPPYWVVLIGAILLYGMIAAMHPSAASSPGAWYEGRIPVIGHFLPSQWFGNFTLTEMWRYHVAGAEANMLMSPSWTLCYEEQFYVVCGLILLAMPRRLFGGLLVISAATAVTLGVSIYRGTNLQGFFFDGRWLTFAAGVLLYYCCNYPTKVSRWLLPLALGLAIAAAKILSRNLARHDASADLQDIGYSIFVGAVFAMLLLILWPFDGRIMRSKVLWPIAIAGRMCYSLYLIHWPLMRVLGNVLYFDAGVRGFWPILTIAVPVLTVTSLAAGWIFYLLVERRFLNSPSPSVAAAPVQVKAVEPQMETIGV